MNDVEFSTVDSHCPECGAPLSADLQRCWLCRWQRESTSTSPLAQPRDQAVARPVAPRPIDHGFSFSLETMMLVMTLSAVGMGAIVLFPGVGILLAIMLLPAFVRTSMVVKRRAEQGRAVALWQRSALFIGSFATSIVILVVVAVASVGTFCAICLSLYSGGAEALSWPAAIITALVATIAAIAFARKWVRRRWRRDTEMK